MGVNYDDDGEYPMVRKDKDSPYGYAVIITNTEFDEATLHQTAPLTETYKTVAKLERSFRYIGLEPLTYSDVRADEIYNLCRDYSEDKDLNDHNCFVMVILSHGVAGHVFCIDAAVKLHDIFQFFNENNCPQLKGKPKLFFIQACRDTSDQEYPFWLYEHLSEEDWQSLNVNYTVDFDELEKQPQLDDNDEIRFLEEESKYKDFNQREEESNQIRRDLAKSESITLVNRKNLTPDEIMQMPDEDFLDEFFPDQPEEDEEEEEDEELSRQCCEAENARIDEMIRRKREAEIEIVKPVCGKIERKRIAVSSKVDQLPPAEKDFLILYNSFFGNQAYMIETPVGSKSLASILGEVIELNGASEDVFCLATRIVNQINYYGGQIPSLCYQLTKTLRFVDCKKDLEIPPPRPSPVGVAATVVPSTPTATTSTSTT